MMDRKAHWERIYTTRALHEVSWYQVQPSRSLHLIASLDVDKAAAIIDIGGGASTLVDYLLDAGFLNLAVLDISGVSIRHAQARLGDGAEQVTWYEADVTAFQSRHRFALWHDRAVFHFLTDEVERQAYVHVLQETVMPGGHAIIATFAIDGPKRCSGLEVRRYDAPLICAALGSGFKLLQATNEAHTTPGQVVQRFTYFVFQKLGSHD